MELLQLEYFVRVAQYGNITRAAQELYVSQPSLSATIARLEKDIGVALFARSANHITLTPAGEVFLRYATQALATLEAGCSAARQADDRQQRRIRVATVFGVTRHIRERYCKEHPEVTVELIMCSSRRELAQLLVQGKADFALSLCRIDDKRLHNQTVMKGRWCVAVQRDLPVKPRVRLAELAQQRLFCSNLGETAEIVRGFFENAGLKCNLLCLDEKDILFDAAEKGLGGVVCMPMFMAQNSGVHFSLIEDVPAPSEVVLVTRKDHTLPEAAYDLMAEAQNYFSQNDRMQENFVSLLP